MILVSTTLTGNNADIIGDALKSVVEWVDVCLVVDTRRDGEPKDNTIEVARSIAGNKLQVAVFQWRNDFAAARNFALGAARHFGGDWAVTLDTDERIWPNGEDIRSILQTTAANTMLMRDASGTYTKDRCFRLPASSSYVGPTHETYIPKGTRIDFQKARFSELFKTPEEYRNKHIRDLAILEHHVRVTPGDPRWLYYLCDTYQNLGQFPEAIGAFEACAACCGWDEEAAWACYRAAECWSKLNRYDRAVHACATGLGHHSGIAELSWLAGFASWKLGNIEKSIWWSKMSIAMGLFQGSGKRVRRDGFRNLVALYEGPYDVLRAAFQMKGDAAAAKEAERLMLQAKTARETSN